MFIVAMVIYGHVTSFSARSIKSKGLKALCASTEGIAMSP